MVVQLSLIALLNVFRKREGEEGMEFMWKLSKELFSRFQRFVPYHFTPNILKMYGVTRIAPGISLGG